MKLDPAMVALAVAVLLLGAALALFGEPAHP